VTNKTRPRIYTQAAGRRLEDELGDVLFDALLLAKVCTALLAFDPHFHRDE
jgi:NTP pyrophosphatase (non-canonical NTP hydrolase)